MKTLNINKYVLYTNTDDSVVCNNDWTTMLFDNRKDAEEECIGYPEKVTHFNKLPIHIKKMILNEK